MASAFPNGGLPARRQRSGAKLRSADDAFARFRHIARDADQLQRVLPGLGYVVEKQVIDTDAPFCLGRHGKRRDQDLSSPSEARRCNARRPGREQPVVPRETLPSRQADF